MSPARKLMGARIVLAGVPTGIFAVLGVRGWLRYIVAHAGSSAWLAGTAIVVATAVAVAAVGAGCIRGYSPSRGAIAAELPMLVFGVFWAALLVIGTVSPNTIAGSRAAVVETGATTVPVLVVAGLLTVWLSLLTVALALQNPHPAVTSTAAAA